MTNQPLWSVWRTRVAWPFQCYSAAWLPSLAVCLLGGLLTVRGQDPKLTNTNYPMDTSVSVGATVSFRVIASSTNPPMAFQWQHEGTNLPAATNQTLVITNVTVIHAGGYRAMVWNASGDSTISRAATLTVDPTFLKVTGDVTKGDADMYYPYWIDLNDDGLLDLVISGGFWAGGKRIMLFSNDGQGNFRRVLTNTLSSTYGSWGALLWGDYDNDGSIDVYAGYSQSEPGWYFHNTGAGQFTKTRANRSWTANGQVVYGMGGACADYDGDGMLDFVVGYFGNTGSGVWGTNSVLHGLGEGRFEVDLSSPLALSHTWPETMAWVDYNGDGYQDLFIVTGAETNQLDILFQNQGNGTFLQIINHPLVQIPALTVGVAWGDYDNDGDLDVLLPNWIATNMLWRNLGNGNFELDSAGPRNHPQGEPMFAQWSDYDNDGYLDLFIPYGYCACRSRLFHNRGDGILEEILTGSPSNEPLGVGCAWGDYDNDGFLDLLVVGVDNAVNYLYRNNLKQVGNTNHWLKVKLHGVASNRDGIGAIIRAKATIGGRAFWQMRQIVSSGHELNLVAQFGLGDAATVEALRVQWPSGIVQELANVPTDQLLTITEHQEGVAQAPSLTATRSGGGATQLTFTGQTNLLYVLEASTNLAQWTKTTVRSNLTGLVNFTDRFATNYSHRFYRAVAP